MSTHVAQVYYFLQEGRFKEMSGHAAQLLGD